MLLSPKLAHANLGILAVLLDLIIPRYTIMNPVKEFSAHLQSKKKKCTNVVLSTLRPMKEIEDLKARWMCRFGV